MNNTPTLQTERLILRRFALSDAESFFRLMSDPEVNRFLPWFPLKTVEEAKNWIRENYLARYADPIGFRYAICLKTDDTPIGYVNVGGEDAYDFGYALQLQYWRRGIVTEASRVVIAQLRQAGIPYITATHDVANPASGGVMKNIGMTYCYSYEELWQPKNFPVTFRMFQLNLDGVHDRVYRKYWDASPVFFIEKDL